jgi:hypothetical protein
MQYKLYRFNQLCRFNPVAYYSSYIYTAAHARPGSDLELAYSVYKNTAGSYITTENIVYSIVYIKLFSLYKETSQRTCLPSCSSRAFGLIDIDSHFISMAH